MKAKAKAEVKRPDVTSRDEKATDCIALLGGMLAGLCTCREVKDVREAVQWWGRNHKAWTHFAAFVAREKAASK